MTFPAGLPKTAIPSRIEDYFAKINKVCAAASVSDLTGQAMDLDAGFDHVAHQARICHAGGNSVFFIGNGGSASIASHQAIDYARNGGIRARALNESATLTCLGNDFGYEHVFSRQLEIQGRPGDMLVAVSSSGQSQNILNGVTAARAHSMAVATFSGFRPDNRLRALGDWNFYVDSDHYGFVEIAHLTLIHAILDTRIIATGSE